MKSRRLAHAALRCWALFQIVARVHAVQSGNVVVWSNQVLPPADPNARFTAVAAGGYQILALRPDGTVVAWGNNASGQSARPIDLTNVIAIAAGASHNLALKADGTVIGWGYNGQGQTNVPATLSGVVRIAAGDYNS